MGDFFYYGQKDTIRRLNELAGRGAVVASYAPAVGRSPLGDANGRITPSWLDPDMPIVTNLAIAAGPVSKLGFVYRNGGGAAQYWKIATLPKSDSSASAVIRVDAVMGGWDASALAAVSFIYGSRGAAPQPAIEWSCSPIIPTGARFVCYMEEDLSYSIYLLFPAGAFAQAAFNVMGQQTTTIQSPKSQASATGTLVWDLGAAAGAAGYTAPRMTSAQGRTSTSGTLFSDLVAVGDSAGNNSYIAPGLANVAATVDREMLRLAIGPSTFQKGLCSWFVSAGHGSLLRDGYKCKMRFYDAQTAGFTADLLSVSGNGKVYMPLLKAGSTDPSTLRHNISRGTAQGDEILYVGRDGAASPSFAVLASDGVGAWGQPLSVIYAGKNSNSSRSISAAGTVNTSGNDYAEYIFKNPHCCVIFPGQIVGITAENKITDQWADAIMFSIKSTAPSFVGGDTWASDLGSRPSPQAGSAPTQPLRREDVVAQQPVPGTNPPEFEDVVTESGDTDEEWAEKQAAYTAALAAHNIAVQQDAVAMATFDAALEVERQKVDRIAIAGRVPVNVQGAQPGDYIVPVQDGAGIKGIAVHEYDLSMKQYFRAVGRVISIEPDGRAYVMVKVV